MTTPTRKPSQRPVSRPPAKPNHDGKPLTAALMKRIERLIEKSEGKITRKQLARDIGKGYQEVVEYMGMYRSSPNSEVTLRMLKWADKHTPKK